MIPRRATQLVRQGVGWARVVVVNGPRQSGKSTLLAQLAGDMDATLVTLDDRSALRAARTDPSGFIAGYTPPLYIDEVQRGGDGLVLAIKAAVDRDPTPGRFVVAGSSRFLTVPTLSESLAGRAHFVDLWPLSQGEHDGTADGLVDALFRASDDPRRLQPPSLNRRDYAERVCRGGFPGVIGLGSDPRRDWYLDYVRTIAEREIASLSRIRQPGTLPGLIRLLAARTAQELVVADLARDAGLKPDTTRAHVDLLATVYVHHLVPAWSRNLTAKQARRPKLHIVDSGLAARLQGYSPEILSDPTIAAFGPLLESFVVGELARQVTWSATRPVLHHLRDRGGLEVDIVLEAEDGRVVGIEVKAAVDVDDRDTRWLRRLRDAAGERFVHGIVLCCTDRPHPLGDRLTALPVSALWSTTAPST